VLSKQSRYFFRQRVGSRCETWIYFQRRTRGHHRRRSLPLGFCRAEEKADRHTRTCDRSGHVHTRTEMPKVAAAVTVEKESEREFPFAAYAAAGRTL
ncbi:Uncharacterized protein DBV15_04991, partial [Temnothorax longispinosus]